MPCEVIWTTRKAAPPAEGIHLGAMAGTVDLLQRCYLGIEARDDVIWFSPLLPVEVRSLSLDICYRRHWMNLAVADGRFTVVLVEMGRGYGAGGPGG